MPVFAAEERIRVRVTRGSSSANAGSLDGPPTQLYFWESELKLLCGFDRAPSAVQLTYLDQPS